MRTRRVREAVEMVGALGAVSLVLGAMLAVVPGRPTGVVRAPLRAVSAGEPVDSVPGRPLREPHDLTVVTANIWRDNPRSRRDVAAILARQPDVLGLNEAGSLLPHLRSVPGYRLVLPRGPRGSGSNPILLRRATLRFLGSGSELMCDRVGTAPPRWAVYALFEHDGTRVAYVNTHMNSHVEDAGVPYPLPRVGRYVEHARRMIGLVRSLRTRGYDVILGGDLNWAWSPRSEQWQHAPTAVFDRLGLRANWAESTAPHGGTFGDRRIDYVAHDPGQLDVRAQTLIRGHSDHLWPMVTYRHQPTMTRTGDGD